MYFRQQGTWSRHHRRRDARRHEDSRRRQVNKLVGRARLSLCKIPTIACILVTSFILLRYRKRLVQNVDIYKWFMPGFPHGTYIQSFPHFPGTLLSNFHRFAFDAHTEKEKKKSTNRIGRIDRRRNSERANCLFVTDMIIHNVLSRIVPFRNTFVIIKLVAFTTRIEPLWPRSRRSSYSRSVA